MSAVNDPGTPSGPAGLLAPIAWRMADRLRREARVGCPMPRAGHGPAMAIEPRRDEHHGQGACPRALEAPTRGRAPRAEARNS